MTKRLVMVSILKNSLVIEKSIYFYFIQSLRIIMIDCIIPALSSSLAIFLGCIQIFSVKNVTVCRYML
jgi:hypothetical protein